MKKHPVDRFLEKVVVGDGCWLWAAYKDKNGYGRFHTHGESFVEWSHRYMWDIAFGPIPKGLEVCHTCDNPPCCNPVHLFLGTHKENIQDAKRKGRNKTNRKLTLDQVDSILTDRRMYKEIAAEFGIATTTVCNIKKRRLWSWVQTVPYVRDRARKHD